MADKQSRGVIETNYGLMWEFVRHTVKGAVGRREVSEGVYDYRDIPFAEISYLDDGGADKSREALTVKLNVDVSDAITGLKAVQREAKEATKALRGVEAQSGDVSITIDGEAIAESLYKPIRADGFKSAYLPIRAKLFDKRPVTDGGDEPQLYISDKREIFEFTTNELADELAKRKEVAEYLLEDNARATIDFGNGYDAVVNAPVRVYVVSDGEGE